MLSLASCSTYRRSLSIKIFLKSYILLTSEEKQPEHFFFFPLYKNMYYMKRK